MNYNINLRSGNHICESKLESLSQDNNYYLTSKQSIQKIKTIIRIKPFSINENDKYSIVFLDSEDNTKIKLTKNSHIFESFYDIVFPMNSKQIEIFKYASDAFIRLIKGFNCTLFTYGQTGTGKTFTMFGSDWTNYEKSILNCDDNSKKYDLMINPFSDDNGLIIRALNYIFKELDNSEKAHQYTVYCSFMQIYNEKLNDLLNNDEDSFSKNLTIREDPSNGIYIEGLTENIVTNVYQCLNILKRGEKLRKKRQTKKNQLSSRSHTVFKIIIENNQIISKGKLKRSKLNLCDLAGSEKYDRESKMNEDHFNEMCNINLSLTNLGIVINSLSTKQNHIPYRDSKLTRILQDSLGGNTLTYLICNISPDIKCFDESMNTLKFADRAKCIMQKIKPNYIMAFDENLIKRLQIEIKSLKEVLNIRKKRGQFNNFEDELLRLKVENDRLKQVMNSNSDFESLLNENKRLKLEIQQIRNINYDIEKDGENTNYSDKLSFDLKAKNERKKYFHETNLIKNNPSKNQDDKTSYHIPEKM